MVKDSRAGRNPTRVVVPIEEEEEVLAGMKIIYNIMGL
jgi:hypothetical protein